MSLNMTMDKKPMKFIRFTDQLTGNIGKGLRAGAIFYEGKVKRMYYSGAPLNVVTGRLGQSPTTRPARLMRRIWQIIVGTMVRYAAVHEKGLFIRTSRSRGFKMPRRPVWGPTAKKYHGEIVEKIRKAATRPLRGR
jgi:phage gpG-like protein